MCANLTQTSQKLQIHAEQGTITLGENRMLLYHAEALGFLRQELIQSLGINLARGVLARFGYGCGYRDFLSTQRMTGLEADDPELILGGPRMHTVEGLVLADCRELNYNLEKGTFYMRGIWRNSYEAEQHIRLFGRGEEPVCWTLAGYASGYATGFMGRRIVAVERQCLGRGDDYCEYELMPEETWGDEGKQDITALQPITIVKSLQHLIREEKKRVQQWRALSEVLAQALLLSPEELAGQFVLQTAGIMEVEKAVLVLKYPETGGEDYKVYFSTGSGQSISSSVIRLEQGTLARLLESDKLIEGSGAEWQGRILSQFGQYLAVPLRYRDRVRGVLIISDRLKGEPFSLEDRELLTIIAYQLTIGLANAIMYAQTDSKLREKVTELDNLTRELKEKHQKLQRSVAIHDELTGLVLKGQGLEAIAGTLARIIGNPVHVEDPEGRILAAAALEGHGFESAFQIADQEKPGHTDPAVPGKDHQWVTAIPEGSSLRLTRIPVVAGEGILGYVSALQVFRPLTDLDVIAMEQASTVVALELLKEKAAEEAEFRFKHDFLDQLLSGQFVSEEAMASQGRAFGLDLNKPWRIILLNLEGLTNIELLQWHEKIGAILRQELPSCLIATQESLLIVLSQLSGKPVRQMVKALENKLGPVLGHIPWWLAVGPEGSSAKECRTAFLEAQAVLQVLRGLGNRKRSLIDEDLTVFGLLQIDKDRFMRFSQNVLGQLLEHDAKYRGQLLETLRLYFEHNGNVQKAAKSCFLSPGTMRYRLRRIREINGIDLDDPDTALQVQLALKIIL